MKTIIVILSLLLASLAAAQTTTTTNCDVNGNQVNCTSTDDNAQQQAKAQQQADNDKAMSDLGSALGTGLANAINNHKLKKQLKQFCAAHPGERVYEGKTFIGGCPGTPSPLYVRQVIISDDKVSAEKAGLARYSTIDGDVLTTHSERASEMRLHMTLNDGVFPRRLKAAHITTWVYTNDKDVTLTYDVNTGQMK